MYTSSSGLCLECFGVCILGSSHEAVVETVATVVPEERQNMGAHQADLIGGNSLNDETEVGEPGIETVVGSGLNAGG